MKIIINFRARTTWTRDSTGPKVVVFTQPLYSLNGNTNLQRNEEMGVCVDRRVVRNELTSGNSYLLRP
jgi:hypothetical protein